MRYSVFLLLAGALTCVLFTPLAIRSAHVLGAVDLPDGKRHLHPLPTPRLGGLALAASCVLLTLAFVPLEATVAAWLSGGAILAALGVTDDLYSLRPMLKLSAMLAICLLPAAFSLTPDAISVGGRAFALPPLLGNLFSVIWTLLLINAFNLIDGSDGLCSVLALVGALALFLAFGNAVALLLFGTVLGFLPYNLPLARGSTRSFLGDTGSLFLGYSLAVLSLEKSAFPLSVSLVFAIPIFDLVRVFFWRILRGKNPFHADRSHLHHLLADKGVSRGGVILISLFISLIVVILATWI